MEEEEIIPIVHLGKFYLNGVIVTNILRSNLSSDQRDIFRAIARTVVGLYR
jgi:hypothetical protein